MFVEQTRLDELMFPLRQLRLEEFLPVNKLQAESLLRSLLPLQGTNELLPQLRQVLLIHLEKERQRGSETGGQVDRLYPARLLT